MDADKRALLCTVLVCAAADGAMLVFAVWLAGNAGKGLMLFVIGGGPLTLMVAPSMYSWFKSHFSLS